MGGVNDQSRQSENSQGYFKGMSGVHMCSSGVYQKNGKAAHIALEVFGIKKLNDLQKEN